MSIGRPGESAEITAEISPGEELGPRVALVDSYDSFVHNIAHALRAQGFVCDVLRHDEVTVNELVAPTFRGWVLGPGPCTPQEAGVGLALVRRLVERCDERPFLGLCLGHQSLAVALGGRVVRAARAIHGRRVPISHDGSGSLAGLPSPLEVTRYNSLVVDQATLPDELVVTARDEDDAIMALRHRSLPLEGIQFHPESWLDRGARGLFRTWFEGVSG